MTTKGNSCHPDVNGIFKVEMTDSPSSVKETFQSAYVTNTDLSISQMKTNSLACPDPIQRSRPLGVFKSIFKPSSPKPQAGIIRGLASWWKRSDDPRSSINSLQDSDKRKEKSSRVNRAFFLVSRLFNRQTNIIADKPNIDKKNSAELTSGNRRNQGFFSGENNVNNEVHINPPNHGISPTGLNQAISKTMEHNFNGSRIKSGCDSRKREVHTIRPQKTRREIGLSTKGWNTSFEIDEERITEDGKPLTYRELFRKWNRWPLQEEMSNGDKYWDYNTYIEQLKIKRREQCCPQCLRNQELFGKPTLLSLSEGVQQKRQPARKNKSSLSFRRFWRFRPRWEQLTQDKNFKNYLKTQRPPTNGRQCPLVDLRAHVRSLGKPESAESPYRRSGLTPPPFDERTMEGLRKLEGILRKSSGQPQLARKRTRDPVIFEDTTERPTKHQRRAENFPSRAI